MKGFDLGLDFTGGTVIEIAIEKFIDLDQLRESLRKASIKELLLQTSGNNNDIIIRIPLVHNATNSQLFNSRIIKMVKKITGQNIIIKRIEYIGPRVNSDLVQSGTIALLSVLFSVLVYISFRFKWRLAVGVVIALLHDIVITVGMLSLFHSEINLMIVASLISVVGYSLNDSIIVLDRIRENFRKICLGTPYEIFNLSLTQTLHRTLITSCITLMVILMLYFFGGPVLESFSFTMIIGVPIGTVSSIYVASALALKLGVKREHFLLQRVEKEEIN